MARICVFALAAQLAAQAPGNGSLLSVLRQDAVDSGKFWTVPLVAEQPQPVVEPLVTPAALLAQAGSPP